MNRVEFIRQLRIALAGSVNYNIVEENVRYYEEYMDMEIRKGKTEQQVLSELGSPRLIAKTIIETNKTAETEHTAYHKDTEYEKEDRRNRRMFKMPLWLMGILVVILIILFFTVLTSLISFLLPVLIPVFIVILVARAVQSIWR